MTMRKGLLDIWLWIGLVIVLMSFMLLLYLQDTAQKSVQGEIKEINSGGGIEANNPVSSPEEKIYEIIPAIYEGYT